MRRVDFEITLKGSLILKVNGPPTTTPVPHLQCILMSEAVELVGMHTKTKRDKDMNVGCWRITVNFSNRLQHHFVSGIVTYLIATVPKAVTVGILSPRQWTLNRPVAALRVQGRPWLIPNLPLPPYHYSSNWNVPGWFLGSFSWLSEGQSPYQDSIWHTKKCPKVHVWQMGELFGQC